MGFNSAFKGLKCLCKSVSPVGCTAVPCRQLLRQRCVASNLWRTSQACFFPRCLFGETFAKFSLTARFARELVNLQCLRSARAYWNIVLVLLKCDLAEDLNCVLTQVLSAKETWHLKYVDGSPNQDCNEVCEVTQLFIWCLCFEAQKEICVQYYRSFKVCKSVHHHTIQINHQPDATISPVYYLDIYLQLDMFRATSRPSSGAQ
jgi:hypothetical protein